MGPRSTSRSISDDGSLVVARVLGPHGIRGEVRLEPRTDVPERLREGATLACDGIGPLTIESVRGEMATPIVRFAGYETRDAAASLRDRFLRVSLDEARRATRGAYLWADLVGLAAVTPEGRALGSVKDLIRAGETDVLVIAGDEGRELLLPMLASVVREVDVANGRIVLAPQEELP